MVQTLNYWWTVALITLVLYIYYILLWVRVSASQGFTWFYFLTKIKKWQSSEVVSSIYRSTNWIHSCLKKKNLLSSFVLVVCLKCCIMFQHPCSLIGKHCLFNLLRLFFSHGAKASLWATDCSLRIKPLQCSVRNEPIQYSPLTVCGHKVCLLYMDMCFCINSDSGLKKKKKMDFLWL